ncbi:toxin-antitoxin system protein [Corynebacterium sp. AOP40-9SA-29]|uniref:toxin-antitoxin system protein n=1 Tax=Corynebacterium sp. AOP40-9SA-29 TaxID=3457677 RepID=UPI004034C867
MSATIKVPVELRDRITRRAREQGVTTPVFLKDLLDRNDRVNRMKAFGRAFATADDSYWDEFHDVDVTLGDVPPDS